MVLLDGTQVVGEVRTDVNGGRQLGQFVVVGGRAARDDDQVRLQGVDGFVVRLLQRAHVDVLVVAVLGQVRGNVALGQPDHVNAQQIQRVQHAEVEDDHPLRVDRHRGGAQLMVHLDGLRVGAEAGRGDKDNEREGKQQGLVEQSVVTRPPGARRRPVRHSESLASGWQVFRAP
jgi:hypothetical protein